MRARDTFIAWLALVVVGVDALIDRGTISSGGKSTTALDSILTTTKDLATTLNSLAEYLGIEEQTTSPQEAALRAAGLRVRQRSDKVMAAAAESDTAPTVVISRSVDVEDMLVHPRAVNETGNMTVVCGGVGIQVGGVNATSMNGTAFANTTSGNGTRCICPLDRFGPSCEIHREFTCNFTMLRPTPNCPPPDYTNNNYLLDAEWPCLSYSRATTPNVDFEYRMYCWFTEPAAPVRAGDNATFTYWVDALPQFALSEPTDAEFKFKLFNFRLLSDEVYAVKTPLMPAHWTGDTTLVSTLPIGTVPDRYYTGGRLYIEAGMNLAVPVPGMNVSTTDHRYVDVQEMAFVPAGPRGLSGGAIAGIVIGSIAGVALIVVAGGCFYRRTKLKKN